MPRSVVAFVIALVLTGGYAKLNGIWPFDPPGQDLVAEGDGQMSDEECARAYLEAYEAGMGAVAESTGDFDVVAIQECDQGVLPTDLPAPAFDPLPAPVDGVRVLFDEPWTVVEGSGGSATVRRL